MMKMDDLKLGSPVLDTSAFFRLKSQDISISVTACLRSLTSWEWEINGTFLRYLEITYRYHHCWRSESF